MVGSSGVAGVSELPFKVDSGKVDSGELNIKKSGFSWIQLDSGQSFSINIWIQVDSGGFRGFSGFRWIQVDSGGFRWIQVDSVDKK